MKHLIQLLTTLSVAVTLVMSVSAQDTAFTYQGVLSEGGVAANGCYDLRFAVYDSSSGGSLVGAVVAPGTTITNGLFTATLDFGAGIFSGAPRWLLIGVRPCIGTKDFTDLFPRQLITSTPYAVTARNVTGVVPGSGLSGSYTNAVVFNSGLNAFRGTFVGNGSLLTNVNAVALGGIGPAGFARLGTSNTFTAEQTFGSGVIFDGPVAFKTNLQGPLAVALGEGKTWEVESAGSNVLMKVDGVSNGHQGVSLLIQAGNSTGTNQNGGDIVLVPGSPTGNGAVGLVVVDGGLVTAGSNAAASFSGSGIGLSNLMAAQLVGLIAGDQLGGSYSNTVLFTSTSNQFYGSFSGDGANLTGLNAGELSSGVLTVAHGGTGADTVAGARSSLGAAASGANTDITSLSGLSTPLSVGQGGTGANTPSAAAANLGTALLGGSNSFGGVNVMSSPANVFMGNFSGNGAGLTSLDAGSLASGTVSDARLSPNVALLNSSPAFAGSVSAGGDLGGARLKVGDGQTLTGDASSILGGRTNIASGSSATVVGGENNTASGDFSLAAGRRATAGHEGAFVWADATDSEFSSTSPNQFLISATGGVGINTNHTSGRALTVNGALGIVGSNTLEFGAGLTDKQDNAGKIGYEVFTPGALDVVGAGTNVASRRINIWAESGATFQGMGPNPGVVINNSVDESAALTLTAPFATWRIGQNKPPDAPSAFDSFFIYQQSAGATRLLITSEGNIGLGVTGPVYPLQLACGAYCTAGGVWTSVSDRNAKEDFRPIQPREILAKVAALPITQWKYKAEANGAQHLGPMAQDFHAAFGLGDSDKAIGSVDADGVTLAAIQGLNEIIKEKDAEIRVLEAKSEELENRLKALETLISRPHRTQYEDRR